MTGAVACVFAVAALALAAEARTYERSVERLLTLPQRNSFDGPWEPPSARVSADGRHVVFTSYAQLSPLDTNRNQNVYALDLMTRRLTLESPRPHGDVDTEESRAPSISGDGRYVVFESVSNDLTAIPGRQIFQVFLRDRDRRIVRLLSAGTNGTPANNHSRNPVISADGNVAVFQSNATNLVDAADANGIRSDIYMIRLDTGTISRVSVSTEGWQARGQSVTPALSADGRVVAFTSQADLTCRHTPMCQPEQRDANSVADVYVRELQSGRTTRVSVSATGDEPNGASYHPSISADGRFVAFASEASNLTPGDTNQRIDIYVRDSVAGTTELISRRPDGRSGSDDSRYPAISADGSRIAFQSLASDLLCYKRCRPEEEDINLLWDVFVLDRHAGAIVRAGHRWMEATRGPSLDGAGRTVVFSSKHPIDSEDRAHDEDLYIWSPVSIPSAPALRK